MQINYQNKLLKSADNKVQVVILDDEAKRAADPEEDGIRSYVQDEEHTKAAQQKEKIKKILRGEV